MIVLTIYETTMLTVHLLAFLLTSRSCDTTYAVLRLPIEAVSPQRTLSL